MRRTGLALLYFVAGAMALGGIGDLTIRHLFDVHVRYLQAGGAPDVPPQTSSLVIHLLHALGGALLGIGIASPALVHFGLRRGHRWAGGALLGATLAGEGANAIGMYAVGSYWYVSASYLVIASLGLALVVLSPEFRRPLAPR
jgi:hypothetical protein